MTSINILGDIMLGRFVAEQYEKKPYQLVSEEVMAKVEDSAFCLANLESPIVSCESEDSLKFAANAELLAQFKWINCFSLSNNHINDFGTQGMKETIETLDNYGIMHNGLYYDEYKPFIINGENEKIAIITCADMMNYEFSEDCPYKTLRVNKPEEIVSCIKDYKNKGFFVILYAHVGMLFTRFPNPVIREFVHQMVDEGVDCVVTAHPHCLGGYEYYNGKLVVYSLGDFLMDGASYRRRRAGVLTLSIDGHKITDWGMSPVYTDESLTVRLAEGKMKQKMQKSFLRVSEKIKSHSEKYKAFYKIQYKKELLAHSMSTLSFEYHKRGLIGMLKTLFNRFGSVGAMAKRVVTDRSGMSYDADAVSEKNYSMEDIR